MRMDPNYPRSNHMETYYGHVKSPQDAIILFEACRVGAISRVQRRLSEKERQQIRSGSVFVWDEREAGMRRWTDGKSWSASRVSGSFLTYREMEGKRGGSNYNSPALGSGQPDPPDGQEGYRYKPDGLIKQSFSIVTTTGANLHLISYYSRAQSAPHSLTSPSTDRALMHIRPDKTLYPDSTVQDGQMPAVTRSPMEDYSRTPGYATSTAHLRHPPPMGGPGPFGWPSPGGPNSPPPNMFPYGAPGYFPAGFQPGQMPYWPHPAYFAPQIQQFQQQQALQQHQHSQHQSEHPHGSTAFDRVPPPLRGAHGPPPPQPPAQSYPQHQATSHGQAPGHPPFHSPIHPSQPRTPSDAIPPFTQSSTHPPPHVSQAARSSAYAPTTAGTSPRSRDRVSPYPPRAPHTTQSPTPPYSRPTTGANGSLSSITNEPSSKNSNVIPGISELINNASTPPPRSMHIPPVIGGGGMQPATSSAPIEEAVPSKPGHKEDVSALRRLDRVWMS